MTTVRPPHPDDLEKEIAELTAYRGGPSELWKTALEQSSERPAEPGWVRRLTSLRVGTLAAACLVLIGVIGVAMLSTPNSARVSFASAPAAPATNKATVTGGYRVLSELDRSVDGRFVTADQSSNQVIVGGLGSPHFDLKSSVQPSEPAAPSERFVVRKANIDLQAADVRATFAKAAHLISEARGEFVESSSLTGDGPAARANLTLRVAADRLGEVLTGLRELGVVISENTTGEDVTNQVVDVEARLRNEQRVESELLDLLASRKDAPLNDILQLRNSLSSVRQSIEQLVAQRDRLGRLVSLSSILVVIRATPEEPKPAAAAPSITDYFVSRISDTWTGGLRFLADTLANLLGLLIGGMLWWLLAAVCIYTIFRYRRRLSARCV